MDELQPDLALPQFLVAEIATGHARYQGVVDRKANNILHAARRDVGASTSQMHRVPDATHVFVNANVVFSTVLVDVWVGFLYQQW